MSHLHGCHGFSGLRLKSCERIHSTTIFSASASRLSFICTFEMKSALSIIQNLCVLMYSHSSKKGWRTLIHNFHYQNAKLWLRKGLQTRRKERRSFSNSMSAKRGNANATWVLGRKEARAWFETRNLIDSIVVICFCIMQITVMYCIVAVAVAVVAVSVLIHRATRHALPRRVHAMLCYAMIE